MRYAKVNPNGTKRATSARLRVTSVACSLTATAAMKQSERLRERRPVSLKQVRGQFGIAALDWNRLRKEVARELFLVRG